MKSRISGFLAFEVGFIKQIIDFRILMFPNEINVFFWLQLANKAYLYGCDLELFVRM